MEAACNLLRVALAMQERVESKPWMYLQGCALWHVGPLLHVTGIGRQCNCTLEGLQGRDASSCQCLLLWL